MVGLAGVSIAGSTAIDALVGKCKACYGRRDCLASFMVDTCALINALYCQRQKPIRATSVYLGGSGMVALKYGYQTHWGLMAVWLVDFVLLGWVNYWLFILLKRLPKMNG